MRPTPEQKAAAHQRVIAAGVEDADRIAGISRFDLDNATRREVVAYLKAFRAAIRSRWSAVIAKRTTRATR
jgi:hypothetical protein